MGEKKNNNIKVTVESLRRLAKNSGFTKSDAAYFQAARNAASESDFDGPHIGCVLVYKGDIIGCGYNSCKTDPAQREYNLRYRNFYEFRSFSNKEHSIHAEMAAIKSVPRSKALNIDWSKVKAYVYRIAPGLPKQQGLAKPCAACAHALFDRGITTVYYSDDYGFAKSVMDSELMGQDKPYIDRYHGSTWRPIPMTV